MLRISCLVLVFIGAINTMQNEEEDKIPLTVYYESQCSDSRDFIINELQPTFKMLEEYFELILIPFGKANSVDDTDFECQHGPTECQGNMMQACTLDIMQDSYSTQEMIDYVACEMNCESGAYGKLDCVREAGVDENEVAYCMESDQGRKLLLRNEYLTNRVRPKFIPTITYDDEFDEDLQKSSLNDLLGTMCSCLSETPPPCADLYNENARRQLLHMNKQYTCNH